MVTRQDPWRRTCPDCGTVFSSVQGWGVCPSCDLRFGVDHDGNIVTPGNRPKDRIRRRTLNIPENVQELVAGLPDSIVRRVGCEFADADQQEVLEMLACFGVERHETGEDDIRNAILDRSHGDQAAVRALIITAKEDWRNLLWGR